MKKQNRTNVLNALKELGGSAYSTTIADRAQLTKRATVAQLKILRGMGAVESVRLVRDIHRHNALEWRLSNE